MRSKTQINAVNGLSSSEVACTRCLDVKSNN
jgi:hypothetical protein